MVLVVSGWMVRVQIVSSVRVFPGIVARRSFHRGFVVINRQQAVMTREHPLCRMGIQSKFKLIIKLCHHHHHSIHNIILCANAYVGKVAPEGIHPKFRSGKGII